MCCVLNGWEFVSFVYGVCVNRLHLYMIDLKSISVVKSTKVGVYVRRNVNLPSQSENW